MSLNYACSKCWRASRGIVMLGLENCSSLYCVMQLVPMHCKSFWERDEVIRWGRTRTGHPWHCLYCWHWNSTLALPSTPQPSARTQHCQKTPKPCWIYDFCGRAFLLMVVADASFVSSVQVHRHEQVCAYLCVGCMSSADIEHACVVARFDAYKTFAFVHCVCRICWRK